MPRRVFVRVIASASDARDFEDEINDSLSKCILPDVQFSSASMGSRGAAMVFVSIREESLAGNRVSDDQKTKADQSPNCPQCGTPMVLRARRDLPEQKFWGCRRFPECKGIVNLDDWVPSQGRTSLQQTQAGNDEDVPF